MTLTPLLRKPLNTLHLAARKGQENKTGEHLAVLPKLALTERTGLPTSDVTPCITNDLGEHENSCGTKSVTLCDDMENAGLADVVSDWALLPQNVKEAILLLVRQNVQSVFIPVYDGRGRRTG